jgi:hypothetical protein
MTVPQVLQMILNSFYEHTFYMESEVCLILAKLYNINIAIWSTTNNVVSLTGNIPGYEIFHMETDYLSVPRVYFSKTPSSVDCSEITINICFHNPSSSLDPTTNEWTFLQEEDMPCNHYEAMNLLNDSFLTVDQIRKEQRIGYQCFDDVFLDRDDQPVVTMDCTTQGDITSTPFLTMNSSKDDFI